MEVAGKEVAGGLVQKCIDAACAGVESVERWRRQRRTLERLPPHLADALLCRLRQRRLLYPSLLEIFQYSVEEVDLNGENCVDAEWMAYLGAFRHLRHLNLADCRGINNSALWTVTGMNTLKELDLSRCSRVTNAGIKHLLSIPNLEKLCISETGVTADGVMLISSLISLRVLDMGGLPVTDNALLTLQVLTQLENLDLWGSKISDHGAEFLKTFPRLSFLNLAWTKVTKLPNLPSIRCLNMSNCIICSVSHGDTRVCAPLAKLLVSGATFVDVDGVFSSLGRSNMTYLDISRSSIHSFQFLNSMKGLHYLDLSFCPMTDNMIQHVAHIGANLKVLNLNNTKITSQAMPVLAVSVTNLQTLFLSHTAIDDESLPYIGMLSSLQALDLSLTNIKGFTYGGKDNLDKWQSLNALQNLVHLENLSLEGTHVRDEVVHPLSLLRGLKSLYLLSDFLSDISLHVLSSLPKLKFLGFCGAVLTNSGLLTFMPQPMLEILDVRGCWLLTKDALLSFSKKHPRVEVKHEHIQMLNGDLNVTVGLSSFQKTAVASQFRRKGEKLLKAPRRYLEMAFVDERIKYSREEMLEMQRSPLSRLALTNANMLPELLSRGKK